MALYLFVFQATNPNLEGVWGKKEKNTLGNSK
jgi:hypothetical protein